MKDYLHHWNMSIAVHLKKILNLPGKYDRKVELSFRGKKINDILMCVDLWIVLISVNHCSYYKVDYFIGFFVRCLSIIFF